MNLTYWCKNNIVAGALANNLCSIEHFQIATIPARIDTEHTVATEQ